MTVNFTSNTYSVAEGIGSVELCVEKDNKIVWPFVVKVVSPNASESSTLRLEECNGRFEYC